MSQPSAHVVGGAWPVPAAIAQSGGAHNGLRAEPAERVAAAVFDNLDNAMAVGLAGDNSPDGLAAVMHGARVRFVECGVPSEADGQASPPYDTIRQATMGFDAGRSRVIGNPAFDERCLCEGLTNRQLGV